MKNDKNKKQIPYDNDYPYEYMPSVSSAHECTGLIPANPISASELEAYNDIYGIVIDGDPEVENPTSKHY